MAAAGLRHARGEGRRGQGYRLRLRRGGEEGRDEGERPGGCRVQSLIENGLFPAGVSPWVSNDAYDASASTLGIEKEPVLYMGPYGALERIYLISDLSQRFLLGLFTIWVFCFWDGQRTWRGGCDGVNARISAAARPGLDNQSRPHLAESGAGQVPFRRPINISVSRSRLLGTLVSAQDSLMRPQKSPICP